MLHHGLAILSADANCRCEVKKANRNWTICLERGQLSATACVAVG